MEPLPQGRGRQARRAVKVRGQDERVVGKRIAVGVGALAAEFVVGGQELGCVTVDCDTAFLVQFGVFSTRPLVVWEMLARV
ncbi:hypothetical protein [Actinosynnema sp. ALI-1.44]|uniref:hypothetical protein n=1 Tax=Actinosynnema sp. ALI-1.44 TaxID=1933779 RepID=UPI00143D3F3C|nr:hypothetical protein [Actinosynnema sp. ALI-1.44]